MDNLRRLDFDDLLVLCRLSQGKSLNHIARELSLTQPAISQRLRKLEQVFNGSVVKKSGRSLELTHLGKAAADKACSAIGLLGNFSKPNERQTLRIGTRPEVGWSLFWPAISAYRKMKPEVTIHCHFGSGQDILAQLTQGSLDGVLTSAPVTLKDFVAKEVLAEDYIILASRHIASKVKKVADLERQIWIEHDPSFSFMRYVKGSIRSRMKFKDVWFTGSTVTMVDAIALGFGVGIVPEYIAKPLLKSKKAERILPEITLEKDFFRLIYRSEPKIEKIVGELVGLLKKQGL